MSLKKNKYIMIKKVVSKELAVFLYNYILIKRQVARTLVNTKYISPFEKMFGSFGDGQVPETYAVYGETILMDKPMRKFFCIIIMQKQKKEKKIYMTRGFI